MQVPQTTIRVAIIIIFLLICMGSDYPAQAQISPQRLQQLKQRYGEWGSIYLSYGTIPDVIQVLENPKRLEFIKTKFNVTPPEELISFFYVNKSPAHRTSVTMFQINFETKVAGYLKNSNLDGTITRVAMGHSEVLRAADWCDLYLINRQEIFRIGAILERSQTPLPEVWKAILTVHSNPFSTEGSIASLLTQYRVLMKSRIKELEALKTDNPDLYMTLTSFAERYDQTTKEYLIDYYKVPIMGATPSPEFPDNMNKYLENYILPNLMLGSMMGTWDLSPPDFYKHLKLEIYEKLEPFLRQPHSDQHKRP